MPHRPKTCRHCGFMALPGPLSRHEAVCLTPRTLERLYQIGRVDTDADGCWPWRPIGVRTSRHQWYPRMAKVKVMRLVAELAYGPPSDISLRPLHSCDNCWCIRADHLRWGTQKENIQDAYDRGRRPSRSAGHFFWDRGPQ